MYEKDPMSQKIYDNTKLIELIVDCLIEVKKEIQTIRKQLDAEMPIRR